MALSWNQGKKYGNAATTLTIWTHLQVSALRLEPVIDEALRVSCEAQHELPLSLQLVNGFNGLMDLRERANIHEGS